MRVVHFLIPPEQRDWGSSVLRGEQLCALCERFLGGPAIAFRLADDAAALRNAIVFATKASLSFLPLERLRALRERDNIMIGDFLDTKIDPAKAALCDTLVSSSHEQDAHFRAAFPRHRIAPVTHHVDLRVPGIVARQDEFRCGYIGELDNARLNDEVAPQVAMIEATDARGVAWMAALPRFNAHYLIRRRQEVDGFKPFLKGFLAAHCGAVVFVDADDREARHYLGDDYPFRYDASTALSASFADFRAQFGSPRWRSALDRMAAVRERSSLAHIRRELETLFAGL